MIQNLTQPQNHLDKFLNPLNPLELQEVLESVISTIANRKEYRHLLGILKSSIEKKEPKIVLKTSRRHYVLQTKYIIHLEADGAYTSFYTTTKKIVVSKNIKYFSHPPKIPYDIKKSQVLRGIKSDLKLGNCLKSCIL